MKTTKNQKLRSLMFAVLVLGVLLPVLFPITIPSPFAVTGVEAQDCAQGYCFVINGHLECNWIANGEPLNASCWTVVNTTLLTGVNDCGLTENAWEFNYGGSLTQYITIPTSKTAPNFEIDYMLTFDDPNNDGAWNKFNMTVTDLTDGVTLATDFYAGNKADLFCTRRVKSWSKNLAGHRIQVRFTGSDGYTDTHIRLRSIALWQYI